MLYSFDFRIGSESGTLIKTAIPAKNDSSLRSCELWAGELCNSNQSEKNNWDNLFQIEKSKSTCDENFFNWRKTLPSGSFNSWDSGKNSCTKKLWVHKNFVADSESKYLQIKSNAECTEAKKPYASYTGEKYISDCDQTYFFYKGVDMLSKDLMQAKLIEEEEIKCKVNRENKRLSSSNGKHIVEASSGECGDYLWICNKRILNSLAQWKETDC